MLKHVVLWKLKESLDGRAKPALLAEMKARLEALPAQIPAIRAFEVGLNVVAAETAHDIVLLSAFDDLAGLQAYAQHPAHVAVADYIKAVAVERRAVDFEAGA